MTIRAKHAREIRRGFTIAKALLVLTGGNKLRAWEHIKFLTEDRSLARRAAVSALVTHNSRVRHYDIRPAKINQIIKSQKTQKKGGR